MAIDAGTAGTDSYKPMAEAVVRHIREAIFDGRLAHGAPLRQESIARDLGVSRIPVREALRQLEMEGLVTIRPHSGARVAILDFAECIEVYKIRERIEPLAFGESVGHLDDEQLEAIRRLAARIEQLSDDSEAWIEADRQFHLAVYAGAGMPRLVKTVIGYWNSTQQYRRILLSTFTPHDFGVFQCDHQLMVDALETHNRRAGEDLMRVHIERARLRLADRRELFDR